MSEKNRLDKACLAYIATRAKAQDAIKEGRVFVNQKQIKKPGFLVKETDEIYIEPKEENYVSRGAYKLKGALDAFQINLEDEIVLDIGASTGGFTQVSLQYGAKKVYALDVGHLQLDPILDADARVIKMEGINARTITNSMFDEPIDFICMDVSFISCKTILEVVFQEIQPKHLVCLIKPQFECGPQYLNKHGVLKNEKIRDKVVQDVYNFIFSFYKNAKIMPSTIEGRSGNQEYLCIASERR